MNLPLWQRLVIWVVCLGGILFAMPNLFYTQVEYSNDAEAAMATGRTDAELEAQAASWPAFLPDSLVNLGLDLRGGAHLLAEVQVEQVYAARMAAMWPTVRDTLAAERDSVGFVTQEAAPDGELHVRISNPSGMDRALELVRGLGNTVVTITGGGESDIAVSARGDIIIITLSEAEKAASDDRTVAQALEIVRRRIDEAGTREPTIMRQGEDRILIQVPGVGSAQEVKDLIGTTAQLTFQPVVTRTSDADAQVGAENELVLAQGEEDVYYVLERSPVVTGEELVDAQPSFDQNGRPAVSFRFNPQGARAFGDYTAENIGSPFAIVLDDEVISAPTIQAHIAGGSGIITGQFSVEESTELAVLLRAGALPAELTFLETRTVGPELGADSIRAGQIAAMFAGAAVFGFMVLAYGLFGVFASIALVFNVILMFAILSLIGATLTLPGIAGIVLTMGMAVDANVLIYERMRDEIRAGKRPTQTISAGFDNALSAIVDSNVTTLIVALIMFALGAGPTRGFAVTLGLGIMTTLFSAVFITRYVIILWYGWRQPKTLDV